MITEEQQAKYFRAGCFFFAQRIASQPISMQGVQSNISLRSLSMLRYAIIFLVIAIIAAALGFGGIAGASAGIAKIVFYIFLALLAVSLVSHLLRKT
ncbi:DUF1328 domain-containing protein [Parasphingorhabdus sp.]|uniref:DUF1328 domain-containing protein n=1 Tax=Parasphingorhabdus sp. TaxID=2709688 RepID=UPI003FA72D6D